MAGINEGAFCVLIKTRRHVIYLKALAYGKGSVCVCFSVSKQESLKTRYQVQTPGPFPHPLRKYKSHGIPHLWLIVSISQMFYCFIFLSPFLALAILFPTFLHLLCVSVSALIFILFSLFFSFLSFSSVLPPSIHPSPLRSLPLLLQTDWFQMLLNSTLLSLLPLFYVNSSSSFFFPLCPLQNKQWLYNLMVGYNFGLDFTGVPVFLTVFIASAAPSASQHWFSTLQSPVIVCVLK